MHKLHREISPNAILIEDLGYNSLTVIGDKNLLFQAFSNLVANSVKYSPGGGTIAVDAHAEEKQVVICVNDDGIGLFLVMVVVDLQLGAIIVLSQKGSGALFEARLPLRET